MKKIVKRLIRLLRFPQEEWLVIKEENATIGELRNNCIVPLMLCVMAASVINCIFSHGINTEDSSVMESLLRICCKEAVACVATIFIGYHIAVLLLSSPFIQKQFNYKPEYNTSARLVAYLFAYYLLISMLVKLFPILFFLYVAMLYLIYTIWYGVPIIFPDLGDENHNRFTLYAFAIIYIPPFVMEKLMDFLTTL